MIKCPICISDDIFKKIYNVKKIWIDIYPVSYCKKCGLYFFNKVPSINEINFFYKYYYDNYLGKKSKYFRIIFYFSLLIKLFFRYIRCKSQYDWIKNKINLDGKSILEVGAMEGMLLNNFKHHTDVKIKGIDYSSYFIKFAKERYNISITNEELFDIKDKYDLVLMSHVLEHFSDINKVILKTKDILKSNGLLFIEVPNSPQCSECDKTELSYYLETSHFYNFNTNNLKRLMLKHKLKIISIDKLFYNLPNYLNNVEKKEITEVLMRGTLYQFNKIKIRYILIIILYIIKSAINPKDSFIRMNIDQNYICNGESIRLIVQNE